MQKIAFGGSCHWCTEAIFQSLKGVIDVQQGWIAANGDDASFSEAVIVEYEAKKVRLEILIAVHLYTHSCTSNHSMRTKYRSAIYTFSEDQLVIAYNAVKYLQREYTEPIITKVIPYRHFRLNEEKFLNYYYSDPEKPFCQNIVNPKLKMLMKRFSNEVNADKLMHLSIQN